MERLWFIYGNYGPKQTRGNHSFIQGLLEHGVDLRPMFTRRTPKSEKPTPECEAAVERVLAFENRFDNSPGAAEERRAGLKVVRPNVQRHTPVDATLKTLLDEFRNGRHHKKRELVEIESDPPDAA